MWSLRVSQVDSLILWRSWCGLCPSFFDLPGWRVVPELTFLTTYRKSMLRTIVAHPASAFIDLVPDYATTGFACRPTVTPRVWHKLARYCFPAQSSKAAYWKKCSFHRWRQCRNTKHARRDLLVLSKSSLRQYSGTSCGCVLLKHGLLCGVIILPSEAFEYLALLYFKARTKCTTDVLHQENEPVQ